MRQPVALYLRIMYVSLPGVLVQARVCCDGAVPACTGRWRTLCCPACGAATASSTGSRNGKIVQLKWQ